MKLKDFLAKWNMSSLKIKPSYLEMDFKFVDADKKAAWDLYIELLTRITAQMLPEEYGDEEGVLESIHSLFKTTRDVLKANGPACVQVTKIAVVVLNQKIRPFTSKWHKHALKGGFRYSTQDKEFRTELAELQIELKNYTKMLADMAGVEDLAEMDE
jgi:hypothetical protein